MWAVSVTGNRNRLVLLLGALILSAGYSYAQFPREYAGLGVLRGEQGDATELPPGEWPDRNVAGCHMYYTSVRREANGSGWRTDYPWAQRNLLIRTAGHLYRIGNRGTQTRGN